MMKKLLFTTLLMIPFFASADAVTAEDAGVVKASDLVPLEKCNETNIEKCDTLPVHEEVPVKESAVITQPWGQVFMTSTVRGHLQPGALNVEVSVKVQCKGQAKKIELINKLSVCSYPVVKTDVDLDSWIFKVTHDPVLNIFSQGDKITLRYLQGGKPANDSLNCGAEAPPKVVANPCLKSEKPN